VGLGEAGRGSSTYRGNHSWQEPKPQRTATRTAVERSWRPTGRQARPSVFDADTHSNSCRTVRRLRGLRKADFMAPGAWSVATDLHSSLNQSLAASSSGSRICLIRGTTLAFSLCRKPRTMQIFGEQRRSGVSSWREVGIRVGTHCLGGPQKDRRHAQGTFIDCIAPHDRARG
jgi:hypothetical protein